MLALYSKTLSNRTGLVSKNALCCLCTQNHCTTALCGGCTVMLGHVFCALAPTTAQRLSLVSHATPAHGFTSMIFFVVYSFLWWAASLRVYLLVPITRLYVLCCPRYSMMAVCLNCFLNSLRCLFWDSQAVTQPVQHRQVGA